MSESTNLAGGKVTYLDGQIANTGTRTVTGVTVQVLFRYLGPRSGAERDPAAEADAHARALRGPGAGGGGCAEARDGREFRLIFDAVSPDWDGAYPQIRIVRVETK